MVSSTTSSRAVFVWTLVVFTTFCYGVRAAPNDFSRRHKDYDTSISPDVLQELQEFGLTENMLQVSHHNRCNQTKGAPRRRNTHSSAKEWAINIDDRTNLWLHTRIQVFWDDDWLLSTFRMSFLPLTSRPKFRLWGWRQQTISKSR